MIPINKALELLSSKWLINQQYVISQIPLLMALDHGQSFDASGIFNEPETNKPYVVACGGDINTCDKYDLMYDDMLYNSVALIPVQGPIMSDNILNLQKYLALADANEKVIAVVLLVNSPGGQVFQLDNICGNIAGMETPVYTYIIGMCCSAATWITSASKRIFCSSPMDVLGSVGIMTSVMDMSGLMKDKLGIDVKDFYASLSTEKNQPVRGMLDPESTAEEKAARTAELQKELDFMNAIFHNTIATNLGIKPDSPVFTGKTFHAEEAIQLGLAHEIQTLDYVIDFAHSEGVKNVLNNFK